MTVYGLKDVARLRLEQISFFVVLLLVCTVLFRFLWNHGFQGLGGLPRIGFRQSFCLAMVLGLGMLVILTMISGIREVLTPGAWLRQGSHYRLTDPSQEPVQKRNLQFLRTALIEYARTHDGRFPPHDFGEEINQKLWEAPDEKGTHYLYFGGLTTGATETLLVVEPPEFGDPRFVLTANGEMKMLSNEEISRRLQLPALP
jgi:hypothetical protein